MRPQIPLLFLFILLRPFTFSQDRDKDGILGAWVTAGGESKVEIYKCDSVTYCGKIIWLRDPLKEGKPLTDDKNPEDSLKSRPVLGLQILRGFTYSGERLWMTLVDEQNLDLRGFVVIPLFGRTEKWTRP